MPATKGANYTGTQLEKFIMDRLEERGYVYIAKEKFKPAMYLDQPVYSKQFFVGQSIYGTNMYCDFILFHPEKHPTPLVIESKWQQAGGSVDEKYPYFVINVQQRYPYKVVLLIDGGGYKPQALEWIKSQKGNNLIEVFSMADFQKWANKGKI